MKTTTLTIEGMTCGNCVRHVTEALRGVPGVREAKVSLDERSAVVAHDDEVATSRLVDAVEEEGYTAKANG